MKHEWDTYCLCEDRWPSATMACRSEIAGGSRVDKAATIQRFLDLCDRKDWDAIAELIGEGYSWLDHTVGTVSQTPEELAIGMAEDDAWEEPHFEVHRLTEGTDGRVFVQMTRTGTLPPGRVWRGI